MKPSAAAIRGVAALQEALDTIGATDEAGDPLGDHAMAKVVCEYELDLRALVFFALRKLAEDAE